MYGNTRDQLLDRARSLGITGRHKMKKELARVIARKQK